MSQVAPNRNREFAALAWVAAWLSPGSWLARARASGSASVWTIGVGAVAAVMSLPLATIVYLALSPAAGVWPHLMRTVLPGALADTLLLLAGVSVLTLAFGTGTAWLVTMYRFPGRALIDRLLVLPLAMPTYIVAYCYVELLDFSGPVQSALRAVFGWHTCQGLLVPRRAQPERCRDRALGRALPLRLPLGSCELRAAIDVRAGGGPHPGTDVGRRPSGAWRCRWRGRLLLRV